MCYLDGMTTEAAHEPEVIGLRELRQHASDIVRRVEAGDTVTVTVSGRPAAQIIPVDRRTWRCWDDIAGLFSPDRAAEGWTADRDRLDDSPTDPWHERR
jgi:prevent-host-death family protein